MYETSYSLAQGDKLPIATNNLGRESLFKTYGIKNSIADAH